jgi:hypothetical protein
MGGGKKPFISGTCPVPSKPYVVTQTSHLFSILTRDHKLLNDILLEAKKEYMAGQQNTISIYISDS